MGGMGKSETLGQCIEHMAREGEREAQTHHDDLARGRGKWRVQESEGVEAPHPVTHIVS